MRFSLVMAALVGIANAAPTLEERQAGTYNNPILWDDLADTDIIRVDDTYYYSSSTMHYSPGAPVLKSYDLVNWEYIGHSVPELTFGPEYYLNGTGNGAYVKGIWASSIGYRKSNGLFYWYGCIMSAGKTFIFTAPSAAGPWTAHTPIDKCYYDLGLLIDDDDTMYIAHGAVNIHVAQLSPDGFSEVRDQVVYTEAAQRYIEGSRFYSINGNHYIFVTKPADEQHIMKSTSGPWGPYEIRQVLSKMPSPVAGAGTPHQGGLVSTPEGKWNYMAFVDAFPGGRIPVLAPIEWDANGWPNVVTDANGGWAVTYPSPVSTYKTVNPVGPYTYNFAGQSALGPRWEWNHNPVNWAWGLGYDGLRLATAAVSTGLYAAPNTLTHRILGPKTQATFSLDISGMIDGDRAGAVLLRDYSAYIGVHRDYGVSRLVYVDGMSMDSNWQTTSNGQVSAEGPVLASNTRLWLRVKADITPASADTRYATFYYSTDGVNFTQLGGSYALRNNWEFFMGYRFGVFNFATNALGGSLLVKDFNLERWS